MRRKTTASVEASTTVSLAYASEYGFGRTSGHQRESFCVKRLAGASSVVCPCIAVWGWSLQRVIGLRRRRTGLPMMTGEVNDVPQCRGGLAPAASLMRR
jgi:hypothetical protein